MLDCWRPWSRPRRSAGRTGRSDRGRTSGSGASNQRPVPACRSRAMAFTDASSRSLNLATRCVGVCGKASTSTCRSVAASGWPRPVSSRRRAARATETAQNQDRAQTRVAHQHDTFAPSVDMPCVTRTHDITRCMMHMHMHMHMRFAPDVGGQTVMGKQELWRSVRCPGLS